MAEEHRILSNVLLVLQVCLGIWQFVKLTPVGGLVKGGMGWLLSLLPFRLSAYALLQRYPGRMFKRVNCIVLSTAAWTQDGLMTVPVRISDYERAEIINISYLGSDYQLRRGDGNKLFVNNKMSYYISESIWQNLMQLQDLGSNEVFIKGCKDFWERVVTGGVMTLSEALDCMILENQIIMSPESDKKWLLPVNLTLSEEKLLKVLNLVGLFLQTKKLFWLTPILLSFASAVLEFNTTLREWLYKNINTVFCWSMHLMCDKLPYSMRREVYSLGKWVENLKPSNDLELRVVRGDICALIGGAAKSHTKDATLVQVPWLNVQGVTQINFECDPFHFRCEFISRFDKCGVDVGYSHDDKAALLVDCKSSDEFVKICTFVDCMAKNRSGSLKSNDRKNKVQVRGWKESVRHYVESGFPPIYELKLEHVIVNGA